MAYEKVKYTTGVTPKGSALFAHVFSPEIYEGKEVGYSIQMKLNKEDTDALIAKIDEELDRAKHEMKLKPGQKWSSEPFLSYREDKDGDIVFKFKTNSEVRFKTGETKKRVVPVYDAHNNIIKDVNIGNGSTVRVAYTIIPYFVSKMINGIKLRLDAVQVIDLVEFGERSATSFGFSEEENGYDGSAAVSSEETFEPDGDF